MADTVVQAKFDARLSVTIKIIKEKIARSIRTTYNYEVKIKKYYLGCICCEQRARARLIRVKIIGSIQSKIIIKSNRYYK